MPDSAAGTGLSSGWKSPLFHPPHFNANLRWSFHLVGELAHSGEPKPLWNTGARCVGEIVSNLDPSYAGCVERRLGQSSHGLGRIASPQVVGVDPIADLDSAFAHSSMEARTADHETIAEDPDHAVASLLPVGPPLANEGNSLIQCCRLVLGPRHPRTQMIEGDFNGFRQGRCVVFGPLPHDQAFGLDSFWKSPHHLSMRRHAVYEATCALFAVWITLSNACGASARELRLSRRSARTTEDLAADRDRFRSCQP